MPFGRFTPAHLQSRARLFAGIIGATIMCACMLAFMAWLFLPWGEGVIKPEKGREVAASLIIIVLMSLFVAIPLTNLAISVREIRKRAKQRL